MCPVDILLSGLHYSLVELVRNVHWWPPVLVPTQRGEHLFAPLQRMSCVSFTQTSRVNYWSTSSHVCDLKQRINMPISYHVMRYVRSPQFFTCNWLECTTWRNKDNAWTYAMSQDASSWRLGYKPLWYLKSIEIIWLHLNQSNIYHPWNNISTCCLHCLVGQSESVLQLGMMSLLVLAVSWGPSNLVGHVSHHLNVSAPGRFEVQAQWNVLVDPAPKCDKLRGLSAEGVTEQFPVVFSSIKHCSSAMKFFNPITSDISTNLTGFQK